MKEAAAIAEPLRILVIEDHVATAEALCRLLQRKIAGCECKLAHRLDVGLRLAREIKYDITLLDLGLPDAGSDEVITSIPLFPKPVIVITDMEDEDSATEIKCYAYEAHNFYTKSQLRAEIGANEGAVLVNSITKAHWRNTLPQRRMATERVARELQHGASELPPYT